MDESFLVEQLTRVRAMSERMSEARKSVVENSARIERDCRLIRTADPLHDIKDLRTCVTYDPLDATARRNRTSSRRRRR